MENERDKLHAPEFAVKGPNNLNFPYMSRVSPLLQLLTVVAKSRHLGITEKKDALQLVATVLYLNALVDVREVYF